MTISPANLGIHETAGGVGVSTAGGRVVLVAPHLEANLAAMLDTRGNGVKGGGR